MKKLGIHSQSGSRFRLRAALLGALLAVGLAAVVPGAVSGAPGTDASVGAYDQCANGKPPSSSSACPDNWINGILNEQNSHYAEDDVTPQRVVLDLPKDGPTTGRTIEISYLTRKSGVHAYDSLATWNHTQTSADRCANLAAADCVGGSPSTFAIPLDPTVVADKNSGGSATSGHQLTGQQFVMYGGTITGVSSYTHDDASGSSDSYARVTVTYSVPSTDATSKVMLLFGGHLAPSLGPRGWGAGVGAGSISGGPYHVRITAADGGSVGSRDNQIMSGAILAPANLVIRKVTVGGNGTFGFSSTGGIASPFSITTANGSGQQAFTSLTPGSYTVTESTPPGGWDFTSLACVDEDNGSTVNGQTANIDLDPGETVTCTYTNTLQTGSVELKKSWIGTPGSATLRIGSSAGGSEIDSATVTSNGTTGANTVPTGTYYVSESVTNAGDYTSSLSCTKNGSNYTPGASDSVVVGKNDVVVCTYTNTRTTGTLTVNKDFVGNGKSVTLKRGATVVATTSTDYAGSPVAVDTGAYTVSEEFVTTGDANLFDKEIRCYKSGASAPAYGPGTSQQVTVGAGESWICDLRNTRKTVNVTVQKQYVGTPTQVQLFVGSKTGNASQNGDQVSDKVEAGSDVNVGESAVPANYDAFIACGTDSAAAGSSKQLTNVTADTTCVVTNKEKPKVNVTKSLSPVADSGRFDLLIGGTAFATSVGNGGTTGFQYVAPSDSLTISEAGNQTDLTKYASSVDCGAKGTSSTTSLAIAVGYGDSVACTITNTRQTGSVTVVKKYVGATTTVTLVIGQNEQQVSTDGASFTKALNTGTEVTVGEKVVPTGYDAFIKCGNDEYAAGSQRTIVVSGVGTTCTVENRQKPIVSVTKQLEPASDAGKFDLQVNGETKKTDAGDNQGTGNVVVAPGPTSIGELAGTGTTLSSYAAQISCGSGKGDATAGATTYAFSVAYGDNVSCTITNTRLTGKLRIDKDFVGQETGNAAVLIKRDTTLISSAQGVTADFTGSEDQLPTGTYLANESFVLPETAALYTSEHRCYDLNAPGYSQANKPAFVGGTSQEVQVTSGSFWICELRNTRKPTSIEVTKTVKAPATQAEPGADAFTFEVTVKNTSAADTITLTGDSFKDFVDTDGAVNGAGAGAQEITIDSLSCGSYTIAAGATTTCELTAKVPGAGSLEPGDYFDYVVVTGTDQTGRTVTDLDDEKVTITDVEPGITVTKVVTGATSLQTPGGSFAYSVTITNTSTVEDVSITSIADFVDSDGTVNGTGTPGSAITMNGLSCSVPFTIAKGGSKVCTFTATVNGPAGTYYDVVVVGGTDNDENAVTGRDDASVTLTATPPPPPPPPSNPTIDVQVVKDATAQVTLGANGTATITYSVLVKNNGPNQANNVTLADAAPSGVVFNQITKQPDFGSCAISPALLQCNLGTMGYGVQTLITFTATVSQQGTVVNSATATGSGGTDTNPANNTDDAQTVVLKPFNPPTPKPQPTKPVAKPALCNTLQVTQKMLKASGKPQLIRATVVQGKKRVVGAKVTIVGPGVRLTVKTNKSGVAVATVRPKGAGIIRVSITNKKACNTQRIGVVGVFEPPVTG